MLRFNRFIDTNFNSLGGTMTKDMTVGNPLKLMIFFSIPLLIGNVFQQLYNMVDAIIVGNTLGVDALAAVGATGSINFLVLGFATGITSGFAVPIAQSFGARDYDELRHRVAMSIILSVFITIITTIASVLGTKAMLQVMKTPENIFKDAELFIKIIYWGIVATMAYNMAAGILRALGDSKTPLYFLVLSSILNVILDYVFILAFHTGVEGAAYATVISQAVSAICCIVYIIKKFPILHLKRKDFTFKVSTAMRLFSVGLPMALQFSVTAIGVMVLQSAINLQGSAVVGAYTAASKVEQLSTQPMVTLGTTMATYCGQNLGAGRYDRIKDGMKYATWLCIGTAIFAIVVVIFGGEMIVRLFVSNPTEEVLQAADTYLSIIAPFFPFLSFLFLYRNALQGVGLSIIPLCAGVAEFFTRIAVAMFLANGVYKVICLASPFAWVAAAVMLWVRYFMYHKELKQKTEDYVSLEM